MPQETHAGPVTVAQSSKFGIEPGIVSENINKYPVPEEEIAECGALFSAVLKDHDDWANLEIGVDASIPPAGGGGENPEQPLAVSCPGPGE